MNLDYSSIKLRLLDLCHTFVNERIENARNAMENAQKAANEEGKSSAGDKYETTRAMMQIERDNSAKQLDAALKLKQSLAQIDASKPTDTISSGHLVLTSKANYFLAISIGSLKLEEFECLAISPISPIGQLLLGKKNDDSISFNNMAIRIEAIY